jgi:hypothetical protein
MHDQCIAASSYDGARERVERHFWILVVDADATLNGDRNGDRALHRIDALRHQLRFCHQTGAPELNPKGKSPTGAVAS